ncbi:MAG: CHAT domain-containing protein [Bacteroidota bacterium]
MQPIILDLPKDKKETLFAISQQFNEELERRASPFPKATTLDALKTALLEVLSEKDREKLKSNEPLQVIHQDVAIRNLPWQLLTENCAVVKSTKKELPTHRPNANYPLKVLIMVAAPEGVTRLDYEKEELQLLSAFSPLMSKGLVEVHFTEDGALSTLDEALTANKYHILHFSGHGMYDREENVGKLALEDELTGKLKMATAEEFNAVLTKAAQKNHRPDLVVLSACQTANGKSGDISGVAGKLLESRKAAPAIIAMAASILDSCAIVFAETLYQWLSQEYNLPYAFQQARLAVKDYESQTFQLAQQGLAPGQWLIPQLLFTQEVEDLVDKNAPKQTLDLSTNVSIVKGDRALLNLRVRPDNYLFVGRRQEKRAAFRVLNEGKAVLLRGQGGVGKTALAEHLAIRKMVQQGKTKVFTHSEKSPSAKSLLDQMTTYLTKEHKRFKIVSELAVKEKLSDQFLHLLSAVSEVCEPFFIFDNAETFQTYDAEQGTHIWNSAQHEDVLTLLQILHQYTSYPVIVTSRYEIAEFPAWSEDMVNMNTAPFGDFFKKCTQLQFHELALELEIDKWNNFKRSDAQLAKFQDIVQLLYDTLGGNYRALEFFDEAYQQDKAQIGDLLKRLDKELLNASKKEVLRRSSENLIFHQLLSYLTPEARGVLSLLTRFRIPVLPMAVAMQRDNLQPLSALKQLTQLTLAEEQHGVDERDRYYVTPLVRELLGQAGFEEVEFDAEQAGGYHEYVADQKIGLDSLSELIEAFEYYYETKIIEPINRIGARLNSYYYSTEQYYTSVYYGLRVETIALEAEVLPEI